jgi:hypothetical protein
MRRGDAKPRRFARLMTSADTKKREAPYPRRAKAQLSLD